MTPQEIFDRVKAHLLTQNAQARNNVNSGCAYRGINGTKCAIGCLIADKDYRLELEGLSMHSVPQFNPPLDDAVSATVGELTSEKRWLLQALQQIHDANNVENWPEALQHLAKREGLRNGESVIVSNSELDILEGMEEGNRLRTIPNPNRVGLLDMYIATLAPKKED
jgi:hypothetical protein